MILRLSLVGYSGESGGKDAERSLVAAFADAEQAAVRLGHAPLTTEDSNSGWTPDDDGTEAWAWREVRSDGSADAFALLVQIKHLDRAVRVQVVE